MVKNGDKWCIVVLTGTFNRSIDENLRLAIPKRLRQALGCGERGRLYVAPGTDGSLAVYGEEAFGRLAERLARVSPTRQQVRDFTRLFYGQAQQVELDAQGRIRLPRHLAEIAQLEKEVVLLGVQDHLELWSLGRWEGYLAEKRGRYDQIAEAAFEGPQSD